MGTGQKIDGGHRHAAEQSPETARFRCREPRSVCNVPRVDDAEDAILAPPGHDTGEILGVKAVRDRNTRRYEGQGTPPASAQQPQACSSQLRRHFGECLACVYGRQLGVEPTDKDASRRAPTGPEGRLPTEHRVGRPNSRLRTMSQYGPSSPRITSIFWPGGCSKRSIDVDPPADERISSTQHPVQPGFEIVSAEGQGRVRERRNAAHVGQQRRVVRRPSVTVPARAGEHHRPNREFAEIPGQLDRALSADSSDRWIVVTDDESSQHGSPARPS